MPYITKPKRKDRDSVSVKRRQKVYQSPLWRQMRQAHLMAHPLCEACKAAGLSTLAVDVHHLRSFTTGPNDEVRAELAYDPRNFCSLCKRCHQRVHHGDLQGCTTLTELRNRAKQNGTSRNNAT